MPDCEYVETTAGLACRWCRRAARSRGKRNCPASRGLGDSLAKGLAALGIAARGDCGCARRKVWLNRLWPYRAVE